MSLALGVSILGLLAWLSYHRSQPSTAALVYFQSDRNGERASYQMHPDGSNLRPLAFSEADLSRQTRSPDGRWQVFSMVERGNTDIYRQATPGGEIMRLTTWAGYDIFPYWTRGVDLGWRPAGVAIAGLGLLVLGLAGGRRRV